MDKNESLEKYQLADKLINGGRHKEALSILDELYEAFPDEKELIYARARCLEQVGRKQEAEDLGKRLIDLYNDPRGHKLQAQIEEQQEAVTPPSPTHDPFDISGVTPPPPPPPATRQDSRFPRVLKVYGVLMMVLGIPCVVMGVVMTFMSVITYLTGRGGGMLRSGGLWLLGVLTFTVGLGLFREKEGAIKACGYFAALCTGMLFAFCLIISFRSIPAAIVPQSEVPFFRIFIWCISLVFVAPMWWPLIQYWVRRRR